MNDRLIGKVIADKYRIDSYLGESRSGSLYLAKHLLIGNAVTVKVLERGEDFDEAFAARFSTEARAVSKIAHPNILNITDFGQDLDGTIYSVMEDASGESLHHRIEREGQFMILTAVRITRQIAAALSAAHAKGMAHGSLTSSKVILASIGEGAELVKVFDVGAVRLKTDPETVRPLDELAYTAPELFEPGSTANERSDVYSLGVVFYEMLAGEPPFTGESETEFAQKQIQVPPPPLVAFRGDLHEGIEPVVLTALAKDPEKRYGSVSQFVSALNEAIDDEGAEDAIVVGSLGSGDESNNVWKTAFIVLAGISVMAFGLIYWTGSRQTDPATTLRTDSNSQPVQPLNPATGIGERNSLATAPATLAADPNEIPADVGGDGYDPWANPGSPPTGQPPQQQVGPGGDYVTIPGEGSVFMPSDGGVILVPKVVPKNTPEDAKSPTPTPKADAGGNTNTQNKPKPATTPAPSKNTTPPKPTPEPKPSGAEKRDPSKGITRDA